MAGGDDRSGGPDATTKTPSFLDELKGPDPWRQATPVEAEPAPEVTLVAEATIDAEYDVQDPVVEDPPPDPDDAPEEGFTETVTAWEEAEEVLDGDGPFAVPVDAPAPRPANPAHDLMSEAFGPPARPSHAGRPGVPLSYGPRALNLEAPPDLSAPPFARMGAEPHVLERRTRRPGAPAGRRAGASPQGRRTPRRYPRMLALLKDEAVARRPGSITPDLPPPVPGTFFPAPREPIAQPEPTDLDRLLVTMAEGLLIGETAEGHTEVRVTLKDEFFAGTELRIAVGEGKVRAVLAPPDREVYWQLNASLDQLKARLSQRGLDVEEIELLDP